MHIFANKDKSSHFDSDSEFKYCINSYRMFIQLKSDNEKTRTRKHYILMGGCWKRRVQVTPRIFL